MKKRKASLKLPILYIVSGLLHFVLMCFGYAVEITGALSEPVHFLYNVYGAIRFGDSAIGSYLCGVAEQFGGQGKLTFFATLSIVFMLVSMLFAVIVIVYGVFDLIKKLAHVDMTPTLRDAAADRRAAVSSRIYQLSILLSFICLLLPCLVNMQASGGGRYLVLPGLGMILLTVAAITEGILQSVFRKKTATQKENPLPEGANECPSCRAHVASGVLYCPVCGVRLPLPEAPKAPESVSSEADTSETDMEEAPAEPVPFQYRKCLGVCAKAYDELTEAADKKGISRRKVSVLTGLCLVLMALSVLSNLATLFMALPRRTAFEPFQNDIWYSYDEPNEKTDIVSYGYILADSVPGEVLDVSYSLDGKTAAVHNYASKKHGLYLCRGKQLQKIADTKYVGYRLSADGSALAYLNDDYQLVLYHIQSGDTEVVVERPYSEYAISPDGSALLYRTQENGKYPLFAYINGTHLQLSGNGIPMGISNDGERIYYYDHERNAVCLRTKDGEVTSLAESEGIRLNMTCYFNLDHSEMLFTLEEKTYLWQKGQTAVKLCDGHAETVGDFEVWGRTVNGTLPIKSFKRLYFLANENDLYYLDSHAEAHFIDGGVKRYSASLTNGVMYYLTDTDQLYRTQSHSATKCTRVATKVSDFLISPDGRDCYYLDKDLTLWHIKHDCKPRTLAGNVLTLTVTNDGLCMFILQDPDSRSYTLYAAKGAGKLYLIDTDVHVVVGNYKRCYYFKAIDYKTYRVYATTSGIRFKEVKRLVQ